MPAPQPAIDPSLFTPPNAPLTVDTGHAIQIEPMGEHGVKVSVSYRTDRAKDKKLLVRILAVVAGLIAILWLLDLFGIISTFMAGGISFILVLFTISTIRQYSVIPRSYVLRADPSGLSIEISDRKSSDTQHFTRPQVVDVALGFGKARGGGPDSGSSAPTFSCWLVIKTTTTSDFHIMQNIGGDHLARVANALRAALGMPPRSWP